MNEFSSDGHPLTPNPEARMAVTGQYGDGAVSSQELAQQILMGMQRDIEAQIDWRLQQRQRKSGRLDGSEIAVILGSAVFGIPLTAIAGDSAGLAGIVVIWVSLVLLNVAWAVRR
jgi:hypothetical protein